MATHHMVPGRIYAVCCKVTTTTTVLKLYGSLATLGLGLYERLIIETMLLAVFWLLLYTSSYSCLSS